MNGAWLTMIDGVDKSPGLFDIVAASRKTEDPIAFFLITFFNDGHIFERNEDIK